VKENVLNWQIALYGVKPYPFFRPQVEPQDMPGLRKRPPFWISRMISTKGIANNGVILGQQDSDSFEGHFPAGFLVVFNATSAKTMAPCHCAESKRRISSNASSRLFTGGARQILCHDVMPGSAGFSGYFKSLMRAAIAKKISGHGPNLYMG
jgi:hypothetical protein